MECPKLDVLPDGSIGRNLNLWADFVELSCLLSLDKEISLGEIASRYYLEKSGDSMSGVENASIRRDSVEMQLSDCFSCIESRHDAFGEYYPFASVDNDTLKAVDVLTEKMKFYLYLLFSSNTKYFKKAEASLFTSSFEHVSAYILSLLYPKFTCEVFGTAARADSLFSGGTLLERLEKLASCFNTNVTARVRKNPDLDVWGGDSGLDVVAFLNLDFDQSKASRVPVCFGQCACTYGQWKVKQHSIQGETWRERIETLTRCHEFLFVPLSMRDNLGGWSPVADMNMLVNVIDRMRFVSIVEMYGEGLGFFRENKAYEEFTAMINSL